MARILLVDDDEDILKIAQRLLIKNNHEVITVANALQALDYLEKFSFDMVISDANMPQMSGFELLIKIRSHENWKNMVVALLTGRKTKNDVQRALRLGVDDYIVKPIDPIIFLEKVESMLQKKEPNKWPSVELASGDKKSEALVGVKFKILSVSELGLLMKSNICPHEGDVFQVQSQLFKDLDLENPLVKVISVHNSASPTEWLIKTHFFGVKDHFLQQIRSWMYQTLLKKVV
jgi:DNA-binding response OmpR family regulator